jgi:urease accessory protein
MNAFRIYQLADASFPSGGFAHSAGLEAAAQLGEVRADSLPAYMEAFAWQTGHASLPFVGAAFDDPNAFATIDAHNDAFLLTAIANRASRAQGRSFASVAAKAFGGPALDALAEAARRRSAPLHHAPVFGVALRALGASRGEALTLFLHGQIRGLSSSAVRLGLVGPHEAQALQARMAGVLDQVVTACSHLAAEDAAATAPRFELVQAQHDSLYSRLFQS